MNPDDHTQAASNATAPVPEAEGPLEKVLRRIGRTQDFPTISKYVIGINRKLAENSLESSASELSNMILKDYALTNKLLKLVNSAFYGFLTCKVTTVTRAVVVLGYDNVRLAAVSLLLFDHFKSRSESGDLKDAAIGSFWCGLIAKQIATLQGDIDPEEAFICALLHQLGTLLTIHHLPQEYREIKRLQSQGKEETRAVKQVLGISYKTLGLAVARQWSFPESILKSMEPLSPKDLTAKGSPDPLCVAANFSNDLCDIINTVPEPRTAAIKKLLRRYKNHITISTKQLETLMDESQESLRKHAAALQFSVKQSDFMSRLSSGQPASQEGAVDIVEAGAIVGGGAGGGQEDKRSAPVPAGDDGPDAADPALTGEDAVSIIQGGVQEVFSAMTGTYEVNEIALMSIEVIYRALGCQRALLFIHDGHRRVMDTRFGYGMDIQRLVGRLTFSTATAATADLFSQSLQKGKDLIVDNAHNAQIHKLLPAWYRRHIDAKAFLFMPVVYRKICVAAYYADLDAFGPPVSPQAHKNLSTLRDQLVQAIRLRR